MRVWDLKRAQRVAHELASSKPVLLKTMVEKELGLTVGDDAHVLRGALVMGVAYGLGGLVPLLPYFFLDVRAAVYVSVSLAAVTLFGMGAVKKSLDRPRLVHQRSGNLRTGRLRWSRRLFLRYAAASCAGRRWSRRINVPTSRGTPLG